MEHNRPEGANRKNRVLLSIINLFLGNKPDWFIIYFLVYYHKNKYLYTMPEKVFNHITATVRSVDDNDIRDMQYSLMPHLVPGDKVEISMHITDGFVCIEFLGTAKDSPTGDNNTQLFNNLAEFFEKYNTDTRFVLIEKSGCL